MKQLRLFFICSIAIFIIIFSSCRKYYEEVPVEQLTSEYIWDVLDSSGQNAILFLNKVYQLLPEGFNRLGGDFLCSASDDAIPSRINANARLLSTGGLTIFFGEDLDNTWTRNYYGIRKATDFLNNFGVVPLKDTASKRYLFGEARISRAMFYWELVRRWGGVPLMGDIVKELDDNVEIPRNSFERCIEYIVSECDRSADSLRAVADDANIGRWTRGGAMALKARVLLYAASPRHNGGNAGDTLTGYTDNQVSRWQRAAQAARDVMNLNLYKLDPSFKDLFLANRSVEVIYAKTRERGNGIENDNGPPGFRTGNGRTSPTQELVDAFGMNNGRAITDPLSGYNPDSPYINRDPRFYATVLYNGARWLNTSLQTYEGSIAGPSTLEKHSQTSYYLRKFMGNFENTNEYSSHYNDFIYFRYAEILLNFAEAQNEFSGPDLDVYGAIDSIRHRAGINPYLLPAGLTQDSMRSIIRLERRKELAFEEHRYWDIRRWKIAGEVYNKDLHGISIIKSAIGSYTYVTVPVLSTVFDESRDYFYPIPYNELVSNRNMVQNRGW